MFSGIVQELGRVSGRSDAQIVIDAERALEGAGIGDSIAVSGCCLTVSRLNPGGFAADVMPETARRTTLGALSPGDAVNLESAVKLGDVVGGHLMTGHVDATGVVIATHTEGDARRITIEAPAPVLELIAPQGSVAVDGISLTVVEVDAIASSFVVSLIPHTLMITTAGQWMVGSRVNLEADLIARYVRRALESAGTASTATRGHLGAEPEPVGAQGSARAERRAANGARSRAPSGSEWRPRPSSTAEKA